MNTLQLSHSRGATAKTKTIFVFLGMILDQYGRVLLTKRKEKIVPEADQKWELPGGKLKFGETPQQTVERELLEETGCQIRAGELFPHAFVSVWKYPAYTQHTVIFCLECELLSTEKIGTLDHHVAESEWYSPESIRSLPLQQGVTFFLSLANIQVLPS